MKNWALVILLLAPYHAGAQPQSVSASQGSYTYVGRSNDPFVFCSEGVPQDGWVAVNPVSGTWTPISQYVNYQWIATYEYICPKAYGVGAWLGPGSGSMIPFMH